MFDTFLSILGFFFQAGLIVPAFFFVLGAAVGCWFYRWMLKRDPAKLNAWAIQANALAAKARSKLE